MPWALRAASVAKIIPKTVEDFPPTKFLEPFLWESAILVAILGQLRAKGGSQNRAFGQHVAKKREKGCPGAVPGKTWNLDGFLMPKWEALGSDKWAAVPCLLHFMRFRRSRNYMKNGWQNGIKNDLKLRLWRTGVGFLRFWEVFGRVWF